MKTELVVCGYAIHNDKVLLIHHRKLDLWLPPGGHMHQDETPDEALVRELKEELNLDVEILNRNDVPSNGNLRKILAVPFHVNVHNVGDHDHCCFFYLCTPKNPEAISANESELKNFAWFSIEELQQELKLQELQIPFIGINQRWHKKLEKQLNGILR